MPMQKFDSRLFYCSTDDSKNAKKYPNHWLCGASKTIIQVDGLEWCRDVMNEDYIPQKFLEDLMEHVEWIHYLATLDTIVLCPRPQLCDEDGYDAHPLYVIDAIDPPRDELQVKNLLLKTMPLRMFRVVPNDQDERPNESVANTRKGGVPLPTGNKIILPPRYPKWLANLTSTPKEGPGHLSIKKVAQSSAKAQNLPPINCLCAGCDVDHLIMDCPSSKAKSQPRRP